MAPLLVLAFLLPASSQGAPPGDFFLEHAPSGDDSYDISLCLRQPATCRNILINYPFYLHNQTAVLRGYNGSYCGYPGFEIKCDNGKEIILQLGNKTYRVLEIDYTNMRVRLVYQEINKDERCPRVDHNVTLLSSSWLSFPDNTVNYLFFLNCQFGSVRPISTSPISCDSFSEQKEELSFVFPGNESLPAELFVVCPRVIEVPVLKLPDGPWNDSQWANGGYGDAVYSGFMLEWKQKKPLECQECELTYGKCAYNQRMEFTGCLCSDERVEPRKCATQISPPSSSTSYSSASTTSGKPFEAWNHYSGFYFSIIGSILRLFISMLQFCLHSFNPSLRAPVFLVAHGVRPRNRSTEVARRLSQSDSFVVAGSLWEQATAE